MAGAEESWITIDTRERGQAEGGAAWDTEIEPAVEDVNEETDTEGVRNKVEGTEMVDMHRAQGASTFKPSARRHVDFQEVFERR